MRSTTKTTQSETPFIQTAPWYAIVPIRRVKNGTQRYSLS